MDKAADNHPLKKAKEVVDEIYKMTQALVLTGSRDSEEAETEAYANLMELREPMVHELVQLKSKIDLEMKATAEFAEIRRTLEDIRTLDTDHLRHIEEIQTNVQDSYKDVKHGQRVHAGYQSIDDDSASRMFDKKQ